jgi:hypothetical protein
VIGPFFLILTRREKLKEIEVPKLAWRLARLAQATELSVPFLRKEIRQGNLPARKCGGIVIVLDEDVRAYLASQKKIEAQNQIEDSATAI